MDSMFTAYLHLLEEAQRSGRTLFNNRNAFIRFDAWCKKRRLSPRAVQRQDVREYANAMTKAGYSPSTVRRHIILLRAVYRNAHGMGMIPADPTTNIMRLLPKLPEKLPEILEANELRRIHAALRSDRPMLRSAFYVLAFSGIRRNELLALRWKPTCDTDSFVDFDKIQLVIKGKAGKIRFVPLHPVVQEELERTFRDSGYLHKTVIVSEWRTQISDRWFNYHLRNLFDRANVKTAATTHAFRKTLTTNLLRQGVRPDIVDNIMGWSPTTIRQRHYTGVSPAEAHKAIALAYADDPIVPEQGAAITSEDSGESGDLIAMRLELLDLQKQLLEAQRELLLAKTG